MVNKKHCVFCDEMGHTQFYCPVKPRDILKNKGKYTKKWTYTRARWLLDHPPDDNGFYYCIVCGKPLVKHRIFEHANYEIVTLDHIISRSRAPELRYDSDNLVPMCLEHNHDKGSLDLKEYHDKIQERKDKLAIPEATEPDFELQD